jgi:hypothetical protein
MPRPRDALAAASTSGAVSRVPASWRKSECRRALKIESYGWLIGAMMGKTLDDSIEGNVEV